MKYTTVLSLILLILLLTACSVGTESTVTQTPPVSTQPEATGADSTAAQKPPASSQTETTGAGNADVEFVRAEQQQDGTWTFTVTVRHPDTGWEDYADGWDVVLPDGAVLKRSADDPFTRLLTHPHENEQPFNRSQSGLEIPEGVDVVTVRAHDLVDGYGGTTVTVDLNQPEGESFEVIRTGD